MGVIRVIHVYLLHKLLCPATLYPGVCHLHTNRWPLPDPRSASLTRICVLRASVHVQDCVPSVHWITLFTCAPMIPSTNGPSTPVQPLVTTQGLRSEHFRLLFTPKTSLNCHFKCRNAAKQAMSCLPKQLTSDHKLTRPPNLWTLIVRNERNQQNINLIT